MRAWCVAVVVVVPAVAAADPIPVPESNLWVGGQIDLGLSGSMSVAADGQTFTLDASHGIGLVGLADYRFSDLITIGLAPRILTSVKPKATNVSGTQYELRGRVTVGGFVTPRVRLHGIGEAGYSWIKNVFATTDPNTGVMTYFTSKGPVVGVGGGMHYTINPRLLFTLELVYQVGYQGATELGQHVDANDTFLSLGGGVIAAID